MAGVPPSTYDEELIVGLISDIYETLIHFGHFEEEEVMWPPAQGHVLDLSHLDSSSVIDERVLSLMRRLPFPDSSNHNSIAIRMRPVCYTDAEELAFSRDIDKRGYWRSPDFWNAQLDMSNALPTEILLMQGEQSDDPSLILDVADGTIRKFNSSRSDQLRGDPFLANETDPQRARDYYSNHRNWPAFDAVDYLSGILTNFENAIWIPTCDDIVCEESFASPWVAELRRRLIEDYEWPHAFRRESWQHDASDIATELMGD